MTSNIMSPELRFVVYMPDDPEAQCYPLRLPKDAEVVDMVKAVCVSHWWGHKLGDEELFLFKCAEPEKPKKTRRDRVMDWLRQNSENDDVQMEPSHRLQKYFRNGPAPEDDEKIDIIVATASILGRPSVSDARPGRPFKRPRLSNSSESQGPQVDVIPAELAHGWEVELSEKWRGFYDYWRTQDYEETVGQSVIRLSFDALGSTDLAHRLPYLNHSSRSIYVVDSYRTLLERVFNYKNADSDGGILVTGQPGTGKTTWLWFVLICLIAKGEPVAFYTGEVTRFFYQNCVYRAGKAKSIDSPSTSTGMPVWCLIDSDISPTPPPEYIVGLTSNTFPVQASSPNHGRYHGWLKQRTGIIWGMPLWSEKDLMQGLELHGDFIKLKSQLENGPDVISFNEYPILASAYQNVLELNDFGNISSQVVLKEMLHLAMRSYGEAPRDVYSGIFKPSVFQAGVAMALENISYTELVRTMRTVATSSVMDAELAPSHRLIAMSVKPGSPKDPDSFKPKFRSALIGEQIMEKFGHLQYQQARDLFNVYRALPEFASAAGWIFEGLAHGVLSGKVNSECAGLLITMVASESSPLRFCTLCGPENPRSELRLRPRGHTLVRFSTTNDLVWPPDPDINSPLENCFCVPKSMTNPLFDSFFVEYKWVEGILTAVIWIFQKTVSKHHDGSSKGYPLIRSIKRTALNRAREIATHTTTSDAAIEPTDINTELKYILLCPGPEENRSWQMPEGWTDSVRGEVFCLFINVSDAAAT